MNDSILAKVRPHAPAIAVLLVCMIVTIMASLFEQHHAEERAAMHASADATQFQRSLQQGIDAYLARNHSLAAHFSALDEAPGEAGVASFDAYMRSADGLRHNPGMSYLGYIRPTARTAPVTEAVPDPAFTYPYLYIFPHDARARSVASLDHATFPERWRALQQARDSGRSVVTPSHLPLAKVSRSPVVVLVTPIYDPKHPSSTVAERRLALRGYVFSIYYIGEMIDQVMGKEFHALFDLEVYDGEVRAENILYDGDRQAHALERDTGMPLAHRAGVDIGGRVWQLLFYAKPVYVQRYNSWIGAAILVFGFVMSAALAAGMLRWTRRSQARWNQRSAQLEFDTVFENHPAAVYSLDVERHILNTNAQALSEFKARKLDVIGRPFERFIVQDKQQAARARFEETLRGNAVSFNSAVADGDGVQVEISVIMIPVKAGRAVASVLAIVQNITAQKQREWRMQESRKMLQMVIDNIPQRVFWKDTNFAFLGCNKAVATDAGLAHPDEIIGRTDFELAWSENAHQYRQDDIETLRTGIAKVNYEEPQDRDDGSSSWLRTSKIPLTDMEGNTIALLGLYEDISERKKMENKLRELAHYDTLTGLTNRAFFLSLLERAVSNRRRRHAPLALMYFDIDHFKEINDSYGHDCGDTLLRAFARRVSDTVRDQDIFARLGGDEFALILDDVADVAVAASIGAKLVAAVRRPFRLGDRSVVVSTSIGIAFFEAGMGPDDLIRRADQAMYSAKRAGRDRYEVASSASAGQLIG
ncbi:sensor domain-containing diguanylate cyclase [Massilia soli]|uniref:Diguanylate cyclase n=1 Tax=Massilia soli TaxID=2792854 RepID=A0ABS7SNK1_9BURK|nr:diguanylate cyclase [Massilia soli]MBZ2207380.1 diguanylate cyclase [Massilia soli]